MKKGKFFAVGMICFGFLMIPSVNAKEIPVSVDEKIDEVIKADTTVDGDILILADGTYIENLTINKNITLKGSSSSKAIIEGSLVIGANVTLDHITVQGTGSELIDVAGKENTEVKILNSVVKFKNYTESDYGKTSWTAGIRLNKTASGTTLMLQNSKVYAQYAVWVYGEKNKVTIDQSELTGWAALDISNGMSATSRALNNEVMISKSTLTGVSYNAVNDTNDYATIVIGGQDGLQMFIQDSTIQNTIKTTNAQDLIAYEPTYLSSKNVIIGIENSTLKNTDTSGSSYVYNIGSEENADTLNLNMFITNNNKIESPKGKEFAEVSGYVDLTTSTTEGKFTLKIPKGLVLDNLEDPEVEGYTFDGWYSDQEYKNAFDFTKPINENTTIYAKFTEIKGEEQKPIDPEPNPGEDPKPEEPKEEIDNPSTSDINLPLLITIGSVSLLGIGFACKQKFSKRHE